MESLSYRIQRLARVLGWGWWRRRRPLERWRSNRVSIANGQATSHGGELLEIFDLTLVTEPTPWHLTFQGANEVSLLPLKRSLRSLDFSPPKEAVTKTTLESQPVVLLSRVEWNNIYHSMVDLYNVFLAARFLGLDPSKVKVVFVDSFPESPFSLWWSTLFAGARRLQELGNTTFVRAIFCPTNHGSYFDGCLGPRPPYVQDLSSMLRHRFELGNSGTKVTLVSRQWCRERVVSNELDLRAELKKRLGEANVDAVCLENLTLSQQMRLMGDTKILVGAHGAGLTLALLLPPTSGVVELFPSLPNAARLDFYNICRWRGLPYRAWVDWRRLSEPPDGRSPCDVMAVADKVERLWNALR